jgi:hypothetical protein
MAHGIVYARAKVDSVLWRRKFRFAVLKSGNMFLIKYGKLPMWPLERTQNKISFFTVKNIATRVCSAPTACRVLGMTSATERANAFEDAAVC